jgi:hypothetical protein
MNTTAIPVDRFLGLICCGITLALITAGCSNQDPKLVAVEGKVTMGNEPVTRGYVIFTPDHKKGNDSKEEPRGNINEDGTYRLMTHVKEGVAPGWYKVAVSAAKQIDPKNPYFTDWLIDPRFNDATTSKIQFEVVKDPAPGRYDIKVEPPPKKK